MKTTHRHLVASFWLSPESDYVDPAYEAEVQRSTEHGEREYRLREGRLKRAEVRLASAQRRHLRTKQIADLTAMVELRREELETYRRLMVSVPASAEHRGTGSFRPVPQGRTL